MRVVIQKVKKASVTVEGNVISKIDKGLMLLVGISTKDTEDDVTKMSNKILSLRVFEDLSHPPHTATKWYGKPWAKSIVDIEGEILSVSQFTLYGTVKKGTKPDFHKAAKGHIAKELYDLFLSQLKTGLDGNKEDSVDSKVKDGEFGAMMDVELINDGPVTIVWDTNDPTL
ncbi:D-Tyr tRNAtyr deacylase-like domain-containing protein [Scheffersomyces amazonensis]|uniref:D-Tyr tRNAtyr deacylase-like domain-containing protein n=1 Tax=Scheffersomyces amazonensis TaxID=1078765 RepID=UPI00315D6D61